MKLKRINVNMMKFMVIALIFFLVAAGSLGMFAAIYPIVAFLLIIHMWLSDNGWRNKLLLCMIYLIILVIQLLFVVFVVFSCEQTGVLFEMKKLVSVCMISAPFLILYLNYLYAVRQRFFPAVRDASAVSMEMIKEAYLRADSVRNTIVKSKASLHPRSLAEIARDIPQHSSTRYLNRNSLTETFFNDCEASLDDEHLYLVISSTGSSSSELISVFTQKEYNHVSISFDRELKTILSYNGGENIYPPGLNREHLEYFNRKEDASMLIYSLRAPKEKKQLVLDKIKEINRNGSAYNLIGLVTKVSIRPNIMFCSQFVYSILRYAGLVYFSERAASVRPSDFIERDYYRKLKFCYEIKFN